MERTGAKKREKANEAKQRKDQFGLQRESENQERERERERERVGHHPTCVMQKTMLY